MMAHTQVLGLATHFRKMEHSHISDNDDMVEKHNTTHYTN